MARQLFTETMITQKYLKRYPNSQRTKSWAGKMVHILTENGVWRTDGHGYTFAGSREAWVLPFERAVERISHCGPEKCGAFLMAPEIQTVSESGLDSFLDDVQKEVWKAVEKFPPPNPTIAALTEETGELAKAMLHIREGKSDDWWRVYDEAVQVAAMACRAALEGDPTIGAMPTSENCK